MIYTCIYTSCPQCSLSDDTTIHLFNWPFQPNNPFSLRPLALSYQCLKIPCKSPLFLRPPSPPTSFLFIRYTFLTPGKLVLLFLFPPDPTPYDPPSLIHLLGRPKINGSRSSSLPFAPPFPLTFSSMFSPLNFSFPFVYSSPFLTQFSSQTF